MPEILRFLHLCVILTVAKALSKDFPMPDPKFNVNNWLGHWYMISRIVPCQWPGSKEFTDFRMYQCMDGNDVLTEDIWRSEGFCSSTVAKFSPVKGLNGAFTARDQIGGTWSSEVRVVLLDVKTGININWGCTQRDMPRYEGEPQRCKDAWVSVASRSLHWNPYAAHLVYQVLSTLGIQRRDLAPMMHTGDGCHFTNQICPRPKKQLHIFY